MDCDTIRCNQILFEAVPNENMSVSLNISLVA